MAQEINTFPNLAAASIAALDIIEAASIAAIDEKGFCTMVLAGGATPRLLYQYLAAPPCLNRSINWPEVHLFWSDERCVEPGDPDSNYGMAKELLLDKINTPPRNIHRMMVEMAPPAMVARAYEEELRAFFAPHPDLQRDRFPSFDLVILGMGTDGHIASLFPGSTALEEQETWAVAVMAPAGKPAVPRISLTLPVLNSARSVIVLTAGAQKKLIIEEIAAGPEDAARVYPAARLHPPTLAWLHAA
jgi:6-phosphogluconolactonase